MTERRPLAFWTVVIGLLIALLWLLQNALLPFVAAFALAYLLEPLVRRLARRLPRWLATTIVLGTVLAAVALALAIAAPPLARQVSAFVERLPDYAARLRSLLGETVDWLSQRAPRLARALDPTPPEAAAPSGDIVGQFLSWTVGFLTSLATGGQAVFGALSVLFIAPIIAFYLLLDWERMARTVDGWLPRDDAPAIRGMARDVDAVIGAFLRGQALVCLFLALWYGIGLLLTGLNFGLLIGLISGLLSFIPYVGSVFGFLVAVAIAIVQFWPDYWQVLLVAAVFMTGQFLESYVISPKIVGAATGLHPVWIMFSLFAAGALFGFVGLLLAVPVAAALGVLAQHGLRAYRASRYYGVADAG